MSGRFDGNPKPMCMGCWRRVYGIGKNDGWWCSICEKWIVKPPRKRKPQRSISGTKDGE